MERSVRPLAGLLLAAALWPSLPLHAAGAHTGLHPVGGEMVVLREVQRTRWSASAHTERRCQPIAPNSACSRGCGAPNQIAQRCARGAVMDAMSPRAGDAPGRPLPACACSTCPVPP